MRIKIIWILSVVIILQILTVLFFPSVASAQNTVNVGQVFQVGFSYPSTPIVTGFKCYQASNLIQIVPYSALVSGNGTCNYPAQSTVGTITIGVSAYSASMESAHGR